MIIKPMDFLLEKPLVFPVSRLVIEDACILDESIIFGEERAGACIV